MEAHLERQKRKCEVTEETRMDAGGGPSRVAFGNNRELGQDPTTRQVVLRA